MVAPLKVGIAGLGTVGAEVVRLIETQSRVLAGRSGRGIRVVAVTARSKAKKRGVDLRGIEWVKDPLALATHPGIDCFVELMGGSGDPAAAPEQEQDYRAALLYAQSGSSPWPICG